MCLFLVTLLCRIIIDFYIRDKEISLKLRILVVQWASGTLAIQFLHVHIIVILYKWTNAAEFRRNLFNKIGE